MLGEESFFSFSFWIKFGWFCGRETPESKGHSGARFFFEIYAARYPGANNLVLPFVGDPRYLVWSRGWDCFVEKISSSFLLYSCSFAVFYFPYFLWFLFFFFVILSFVWCKTKPCTEWKSWRRRTSSILILFPSDLLLPPRCHRLSSDPPDRKDDLFTQELKTSPSSVDRVDDSKRWEGENGTKRKKKRKFLMDFARRIFFFFYTFSFL